MLEHKPLRKSEQFYLSPDEVPRQHLLAISKVLIRSNNTAIQLGNVYWVNLTFNTLELSLPLQGVFPGTGETPDGVILIDTAENLVAALPQLSEGQLDSFTKIIVENNSQLTLDPETFAKLDTTAFEREGTTHAGTNLVNANGTDVEIVLISNGITDLADAGLFNESTGELNSSITGLRPKSN